MAEGRGGCLYVKRRNLLGKGNIDQQSFTVDQLTLVLVLLQEVDA